MGNLEVNKVGIQREDNFEEKTVRDQNGNLLITKRRNKNNRFGDKRLKVNNPHLITPVSVNDHNITFPQFPHTLKQIIMARRQQSLFQESELLALLRGVCSALASLQLCGVYHGHIIPENIYYEASTGAFKIYDHELYTGGPVNYSNASNLFYYAPEILQGMKENKAVTNLETLSKSDVFSFGMVMLEAASLQSSAECYNYQTKMMDYGLLDQRLAFLRQNYPIQFAHIIKIMITPDQSIRPDCVEIFKIVTNQGPGKVQVNVRKYNYEQANARIMAKQGEPGLNMKGNNQNQVPNNMQNQTNGNLKSTQFINSNLQSGLNLPNGQYQPPQPQLQNPQIQPADYYSQNNMNPMVNQNPQFAQVQQQEVLNHAQYTNNVQNHVPFQDIGNQQNQAFYQQQPNQAEAFQFQSPKPQRLNYATNFDPQGGNPYQQQNQMDQQMMGNSMMMNQLQNNQVYMNSGQMTSPNLQIQKNLMKSPTKQVRNFGTEFRSPNYVPNTMLDVQKLQRTALPENPHRKLEERLDEVMMRSRNLMQEIMGQLKKDSDTN